jgi:predicted DNA-binding transcriptional regulator YafY
MDGMRTMRASRLLQILLLLQNRERMTSAQLALELEVARRTILRDTPMRPRRFQSCCLGR